MDIRRLFDQHRISWVDHGPNTSRNHVNIPCPFCGQGDRGNHLAINESTLEYYCFRNPAHAGKKIGWLLKALKIPYKSDQHITQGQRSEVKVDRSYAAFHYFTPAQENDEALAYLQSRLFSSPIETCKKFNLKVSNAGEWAGRLIIPLNIGWTGRAMRPHFELRYKAETSEDGFFFFTNNSSSAIILEGAIDGMRVATISTQFDIIGKCGNRLSPALLNTLRERSYLSIYNAPDGTVPFLQYQRETQLLRSYCTSASVKKIGMPNGFKDFGELSESQSRRWVGEVCQQ